MLTHRLFGGGSSSPSVSRPSLRSALIAAARALLWSSFRRRSESPLLAHQETKRQEKVSCLFASCRPFPVSLPASRGALTPSGCVHAANPSPLPAIRPKPKPQLPPVGLLCLFSFIRTEFFLAKFVCCCRFRRDQILWNKSSLGKLGSLFLSCFTYRDV